MCIRDRWYYSALKERMEQFNLELESSKSRLIEFGRFAEANRTARGEGKPEAFDFLGFTFYCGKTRKGTFAVKLQTSRKKFERKLKDYKLWIYAVSYTHLDVYKRQTRLKQEISSGKAKVSQLQQKLLVYKVEQIPQSQEVVVWFEEELEGNAPRELTNLIIENGASIGAVFAGDEKDGYRYVIGSKSCLLYTSRCV